VIPIAVIPIKELQDRFEKIFGRKETKVFQAPGRVNIIGEHTDYNDGFVLPVCIDKSIRVVTARSQNSRTIRIRSLEFENPVCFRLDDISYKKEDNWGNYVKGVAKTLQSTGYHLMGVDMLFSGDIPVASGLSSSAALEVASTLAFAECSGFSLDPIKIAKICQKAENEFIGVKCGIMDQFIIAGGKEDHAIFLDCRDLSFEYVPFQLKGISLVVCNTKVKRELKSSEYNLRREECTKAVQHFKKYIPTIESLRDVDEEILRKYKNGLSQNCLKRARHVTTENKRVKETVALARSGDLNGIGNLLLESHNSLKNCYEVSCKELDIMVDSVLRVRGVLGARMTGAGFGGCALALVKTDQIEIFIQQAGEEYRKKTGINPDFYTCEVTAGAQRVL